MVNEPRAENEIMDAHLGANEGRLATAGGLPYDH